MLTFNQQNNATLGAFIFHLKERLLDPGLPGTFQHPSCHLSLTGHAGREMGGIFSLHMNCCVRCHCGDQRCLDNNCEGLLEYCSFSPELRNYLLWSPSAHFSSMFLRHTLPWYKYISNSSSSESHLLPPLSLSSTIWTTGYLQNWLLYKKYVSFSH